MVKDFFKNNWQVFLYNILIILLCIVFWGRFGDAFVDSFREAYIPEQMLKGQVLYKNIFCIYAPLSYLINEFLYKIFGVSLNVLYISSLFITLGIFNLVYVIANKFMDKNCSLAVILFFIASSFLSPNVFNFILPYSFGITYGLLFILLSVYFILNKKIAPACIMYSLACLCKYEFIMLLPVLLVEGRNEKTWKKLLALISPIIITSLILKLQGCDLESVLVSISTVFAMSSTKTIQWFYSMSGLMFKWQLIPVYLVSICKFFIPLAIVYYFRSRWLYIPVLVWYFLFAKQDILLFAFPLIFVLFVLRYKNLEHPERIFVISSLLISVKVFFATAIQSYGAYFIPLALISLIILMPKYLKKHLCTIILLASVAVGWLNIKVLNEKSYEIATDRGVIYTYPEIANAFGVLVNYVNGKTKENERVCVYPEGLLLNFMAERSSDNKFYSLIPLYTETFGEDTIISRFNIKKPEYIVISNYNTNMYYYSFFGQDYANEIYNYVLENYTLHAKIGRHCQFNVFRLSSRYPSP